MAEEPFPLVIFVHGSGATGPDLYLAWIEHLVRRGAVVLYPLYQSTTYREAEYRQALLDGVTRALERLEREGVPVDDDGDALAVHDADGELEPVVVGGRHRPLGAEGVEEVEHPGLERRRRR